MYKFRDFMYKAQNKQQSLYVSAQHMSRLPHYSLAVRPFLPPSLRSAVVCSRVVTKRPKKSKDLSSLRGARRRVRSQEE